MATDKETNITYAVKILNKKHIIAQKKVECVTREKVLLDMLRHPNIVNLYFTFSDPDNLRILSKNEPQSEFKGQSFIFSNRCFLLQITSLNTALMVNCWTISKRY